MAVPQTSEHGGFIRGLATELDTGGHAVDAAIVRDALVNNALHLLDLSGQVLVHEVALAATDIELTSPPTTTPVLMPGCEWRVPLRVRHGDNRTQSVVVYMRAAISAAGTATFRISLRWPGAMTSVAPLDPASFAAPYVREVSTTSTTGADLAATLYVGPEMVARAPFWVAPSEDGGGDPSGALTLVGVLQVWAKSSSGSSNPQIHTINVRESAGER